MANRIMLNTTSYHGAGAIDEIATEAKAHAFKKAFFVLILILSNLMLHLRLQTSWTRTI